MSDRDISIHLLLVTLSKSAVVGLSPILEMLATKLLQGLDQVFSYKRRDDLEANFLLKNGGIEYQPHEFESLNVIRITLCSSLYKAGTD